MFDSSFSYLASGYPFARVDRRRAGDVSRPFFFSVVFLTTLDCSRLLHRATESTAQTDAQAGNRRREGRHEAGQLSDTRNSASA